MKKKIFKFKSEYAKLVESMTEKQAGEFIKAVSGYVFFGKPLESKDDYLKGVYIYIQSELETEARNSANGKLGGAVRAEEIKNRKTASIEMEGMLTGGVVAGHAIEKYVEALNKCGKAEHR